MSNQPVLLTLQRRYTSSAIEDILLGQSKYIPNFASIHLLTSVHGAGLKTRQALSLGLCPRFQTFASRTIKNPSALPLQERVPQKGRAPARAGCSRFFIVRDAKVFHSSAKALCPRAEFLSPFRGWPQQDAGHGIQDVAFWGKPVHVSHLNGDKSYGPRWADGNSRG